MKPIQYIILVFVVFSFYSENVKAQDRENPAEVKKLARSLTQSAGQSSCKGNFSVGESRRSDDATWYEVSYLLNKKSLVRQSFKSSAIEQYVGLTPIKLSGCNSLFITYSMGASGAYQDSYLIYPSGSRFNSVSLSSLREGYFNVEDLDKNGETEIIVNKSVAANLDFPCDKFAYWASIFHFNSTSGRLTEMRSELYPKFYASLAQILRSNYQNYRNDRTVSRSCHQTFQQLIAKAEALAKNKK